MFTVLTAYAIFSKGDMTLKGGAMCSLANSLLFLILFQFVFGGGKFLHLLIAVVAVIIIGIFMVYDTQIIVGGKHKKFQLSPDDYAIGAIILYSDIIMMFLYLLQIFGGGSNN